MAQLDVAKKHLAAMRAHLKRALVALRERLVAIYETGTPDVLSVILGSGGFDDLVDRAEYLNRIHGMDDAVVGRVRELRNEVKRTVARLRTAKDRIEVRPRRDRRRRAGAGERPRRRAGPPVGAGRRPREPRRSAGEDPQARSRSWTARWPRSRARSRPSCRDRRSAPLAGRPDPGRQRQRA